MSEFQVKTQLENILGPWNRINHNNLAEQLSLVNIGILEIARRCSLSPQEVLNNIPHVINLDGTSIRPFVKSGKIPEKKLRRKSVKEPPIKGLRNGPKRFRQKRFERLKQKEEIARKAIGFKTIDPEAEIRKEIERKEEERSRWDRIIMRKKKRKGLMEGSNGITINMQDPELRKLRGLVDIKEEDIKTIAENMIQKPGLFAFDFLEMLGLDQQTLRSIHRNHEILQAISPQERISMTNKLINIINSLPTMHVSLSKARIHPATSFESGVPLFFGMGGGSRMPCQGLPLDVLKMVLTGEKLRRELGLTQCFVLGADVITYTNIDRDRTEGFTKEKIDQVIGTEIALLNELFKRFGFNEWKAIRQSQLSDHFSKEKVEEWKHNIEQADKVDLVGGHHYAIEMSDIQLLVQNGIKLGWFIRQLSGTKEYIMDEQPFHARFALLMALMKKPHATTLLYTHAGSRLIPGNDGRLQKEPPYITYTPNNRLLLSPFEEVERKLIWAETRGGGLQLSFVDEQMQALINLFEELVIKIPTKGKTKQEIMSSKLQFIIDQGVGNDTHLGAMWKEAFPNSL